MKKLFALVVSVLALTIVAGPAQAADEPMMLLSAASEPLGAKYQAGAEGPDRFDCSGYVWWTYNGAGLGDRIGGKRMRAREYQTWMRQHDALYTDRTKAKVGDLAFWGTPAVHIGIVTRVTHPKAKKWNVFVTSATTVGVIEARYDLLTAKKPFSNFGRVDLVNTPDPTPVPTDTPLPTETPFPTETPLPTPTA